MITRQKTLAARTKSFLGRSALFRTRLLTPAGSVTLNDCVVYEYSPAPVVAVAVAPAARPRMVLSGHLVSGFGRNAE